MRLYTEGEAMGYWEKYSDPNTQTMSYEQFSEGYREAEPDVADEMIQGAWFMGDLN